MGRIRKMVQGAKGSRAPTAIGGVLALAQLMGIPGKIHEALTGDEDRRKRELSEKFAEIESRMAGYRMETERRAAGVRANLENVAMTSPQLYNQVKAGRRLPRGATVIGGSPREDLLESLGASMMDGEYTRGPVS